MAEQVLKQSCAHRFVFSGYFDMRVNETCSKCEQRRSRPFYTSLDDMKKDGLEDEQKNLLSIEKLHSERKLTCVISCPWNLRCNHCKNNAFNLRDEQTHLQTIEKLFSEEKLTQGLPCKAKCPWHLKYKHLHQSDQGLSLMVIYKDNWGRRQTTGHFFTFTLKPWQVKYLDDLLPTPSAVNQIILSYADNNQIVPISELCQDCKNLIPKSNTRKHQKKMITHKLCEKLASYIWKHE